MKRVLIALVVLNLTFLGYSRLVSESAPTPGPAEPGVAVPRLALVSEFEPATGPGCVSLGPFADRAVASQVAAWLRGLHLTARERSAEADGIPSYSVAVTTKTMQEAARLSNRLKEAGISDVEVTPPGANQTTATVSLGMYSERDRAERRVADVKRIGVDPAIVEQQRRVTQWWLDVLRRAGDPPLDAAALQKAVPAAAGSSAVACPSAAGRPAGAAPAAQSAPRNRPSTEPAPAKLSPAPA